MQGKNSAMRINCRVDEGKIKWQNGIEMRAKSDKKNCQEISSEPCRSNNQNSRVC